MMATAELGPRTQLGLPVVSATILVDRAPSARRVCCCAKAMASLVGTASSSAPCGALLLAPATTLCSASRDPIDDFPPPAGQNLARPQALGLGAARLVTQKCQRGGSARRHAPHRAHLIRRGRRPAVQGGDFLRTPDHLHIAFDLFVRVRVFVPGILGPHVDMVA